MATREDYISAYSWTGANVDEAVRRALSSHNPPETRTIETILDQLNDGLANLNTAFTSLNNQINGESSWGTNVSNAISDLSTRVLAIEAELNRSNARILYKNTSVRDISTVTVEPHDLYEGRMPIRFNTGMDSITRLALHYIDNELLVPPVSDLGDRHGYAIAVDVDDEHVFGSAMDTWRIYKYGYSTVRESDASIIYHDFMIDVSVDGATVIFTPSFDAAQYAPPDGKQMIFYAIRDFINEG